VELIKYHKGFVRVLIWNVTRYILVGVFHKRRWISGLSAASNCWSE